MARYVDLDDADVVYCGNDGDYEKYNIPTGMPSADVQPVRRGHWIHVRTEENGNALYECSVCGKGEVHVPIVEVHYCWNCGARMDGEQDE